MVNIIDKDFATRFQDAVTILETESGYALKRSDAERLMIQVIVSVMQQGAIALDANAQQVFLRSMSGDNLDYYGEMFGVDRLASDPAKATIRFTFTSALLFSITASRLDRNHITA